MGLAATWAGSCEALLAAEPIQFVEWYHDGAAKRITKMNGKMAAAARIKMNLHDAGDRCFDQLKKAYVLRIQACFATFGPSGGDAVARARPRRNRKKKAKATGAEGGGATHGVLPVCRCRPSADLAVEP
jgi:hypothetical protein